MVTIEHEQNGCIGCMLCTSICPTYWYMNGEGMATLYTVEDMNKGLTIGKGFRDDIKDLKQAEASCPVNIITIQD